VRVFNGHNFYGAGNMGDDLMLAGFLGALATVAPDASVTACTPHDVKSQRRRFPSVRWLPDDEGTREAALREAGVWLGLGDTPFQLDSGPWMLEHLERERERCERLGIAMAFLGVGCGSRAAVEDPRARSVIDRAERIWARDTASAELLEAIAPRGAVVLGADLAHLALGAAAVQPVEPGLLGLLFGLHRPGIIDILAVEEAVARRAPRTTRWLVQEARTFPCTERWNYAALSEQTQLRVELMSLDYAHDDFATYLRRFGAPEIVITSRYHGALVAAWHGVRAAVVARSAKLEAVAAELDLPSRALIETASDLEALVAQARPVNPERRRELHDRAHAMCVDFVAWRSSLA